MVSHWGWLVIKFTFSIYIYIGLILYIYTITNYIHIYTYIYTYIYVWFYMKTHEQKFYIHIYICMILHEDTWTIIIHILPPLPIPKISLIHCRMSPLGRSLVMQQSHRMSKCWPISRWEIPIKKGFENSMPVLES